MGIITNMCCCDQIPSWQYGVNTIGPQYFDTFLAPNRAIGWITSTLISLIKGIFVLAVLQSSYVRNISMNGTRQYKTST